ncbi:Dipeptidyl peptidase 4 [Lamellibrachia satsuma]|nr:Dipeptidyl peptidase 4 [Lamellibrachia satsuma]
MESNLILISSGSAVVGLTGNSRNRHLNFGEMRLVPRKTSTKTGTKYKIATLKPGSPAEDFVDFPNGDEFKGRRLQFAGWSPEGHALVFVYKNDLYYQETPMSHPVQVTSSGDEKFIFNGIPDWLYEEDVLSSRVAHYWSPDGAHICFARFNDTGIPLIKFPHYGPSTDMYNDITEIAYPKAGDVTDDGRPGPNTVAELFIMSTANPKAAPRKLQPPTDLRAIDHYYTRVAWRDVNHVFVTWAVRSLNRSIVTICDVTTLDCQTNLDRSVTNGWTDSPWPRPLFIDGGDRYLTILPRDGDTAGGPWRQLALVTSPMGKEGIISFLTTADQEVTKVLAYDERRKLVYYLTTNGNPTERHLARVGTPEAEEKYKYSECLTCNVTGCSYVTASFSDSAHYYVLHCLGPDVPSATLRYVDNTLEKSLEDNAELKARLAQKALPKRTFIDIDVGGGFRSQAEIFLPPNYKEGNKYPLLVYTYGGPNSQRVSKRYPLGAGIANWLTHVMSSHGVVVASVDGRGTASRGDSFRYSVYRRQFTVEVDDQIDAGRFFKQMKFVDETKKAAIFGWSYGGGMVSHVMGTDKDVFDCGIAVAPVTNKLYYDTAYSERFMGFATPDDNKEGYNLTDVSSKANNFQNKTYLIAHGTADDNVHFMNAAQVIKALIEAEVQFKQLIYIDKAHSITGKRTRRHLFRALTNFLLNDCWKRQ